MTCERFEFVTNAYKYSASVADFEQMANLFIRKHIRKHIRLCVRAALRLEAIYINLDIIITVKQTMLMAHGKGQHVYIICMLSMSPDIII